MPKCAPTVGNFPIESPTILEMLWGPKIEDHAETQAQPGPDAGIGHKGVHQSATGLRSSIVWEEWHHGEWGPVG